MCLLQSVMNMMHVISVPYSLMKVNPLSWIQKVCQYKGQTPMQRSLILPITQDKRSFSLCLCPDCSQGGVCEVQGHALGSGGPQRPEGHQSELAAHAAGG